MVLHVRNLILASLVLLLPLEAWAKNDWKEEVVRFSREHCVSCHSGPEAASSLNLETLSVDVSDHELRRRWTQIHDRVAKGEMPPKDAPRPALREQETFLAGLSGALIEADTRSRPSLTRRLNRVEYENTIRDLFGVHVDLREMLPEDQATHGFDTVGEGLGLSAEQIEVYLEAADRALDQVFGAPKAPPRVDVELPLGEDGFAKRSIGRLFQKTEDGALITFQGGWCPSVFHSGQAKVDGTYRVRIEARTFQTDQPLVMAVYGGDVIVGRRPKHLVGYYDVVPGDEWTVVEFEDSLEASGCYQMKPYGLSAPTQGPKRFDGPGLVIGKVKVEGPLESWPPPSRAQLLGDVDPKSAALDDARLIFARLLPRAFRREIAPDEVQPYVALTQSALEEGQPFEEALRVGLQGILCSPEFLFVQQDAPIAGAEEPATGSQFALASRLSYFLWSSMPDATLLEHARAGRLSRPEVLRGEVERLLRDPKSKRFVDNFTGQWLGLRDIDETEPDARLFPEYDERLRHAMLEETHRYFRTVLDDDLPLIEFVDSDWSILNEPLAEHYGIAGVVGHEFRRVRLPADSVRGGVLTQASVLKVTANGTNTSPVVRGVWVLENILGDPPAPPPASVSAIEPDIRGATTIREQLEKHRNVASCAGCHSRIDPPGFALESFDPIGGWRDWYRAVGTKQRVDRRVRGRRVEYGRGLDVDPSGETAAGKRFTGIQEFKTLLLEDKDQIARCLTEKLMTYALGRGLGFSDRPAIDALVAESKRDQYRFRALIHAIVQSPTFRGASP